MAKKMADLQLGARTALQAVFILVGLTILKGTVGYFTNTIVLMADAVGSFGDIFAMLAIYIGLLMSQRQADKKFSYGYHRIETLVSFIVAVFMLYLAYEIMFESITRIHEPHETFHSGIGIAAAAVSIIASIAAYIRLKQVGKKINSSAMITSAIDKRNDTVVSSGVLVGIIGNIYSIPYIEGIIGIFIGIMIFVTGLKASRDAILYLLDYWDAPEVTGQIKKILKKSKMITAITSIRLRHAGTFIFGEALVQVNPFTDMKDFSDEMRRLHLKIADEVKHVGDFVIYVDPPKPKCVRIAIPVTNSEKGLDAHISTDFLNEFSYLFVTIENGAIKEVISRPNQFKEYQIRKIGEFLRGNGVNILIHGNISALLYYYLRVNNIKVYPHFSNLKTVRETMKLLVLDV